MDKNLSFRLSILAAAISLALAGNALAQPATATPSTTRLRQHQQHQQLQQLLQLQLQPRRRRSCHPRYWRTWRLRCRG